MNAQVLINLDDISKLLIVDYFCDQVRKINCKKCEEVSKLLSSCNLEKMYSEFIHNGDIEIIISRLECIMTDLNLYSKFSIPYRSWQRNFFKLYLKFFHHNSVTKLVKCNRYSQDSFVGVKVIASTDIKMNSVIKEVFGYYKPLSSYEEEILVEQYNDFSVIRSCKSKKHNIFLGSIAFVNHDCNPNVEYITREKHMVYLRSIKNVTKGEELLVYYGSNYFGDENQFCECLSCKTHDSIIHSDEPSVMYRESPSKSNLNGFSKFLQPAHDDNENSSIVKNVNNTSRAFIQLNGKNIDNMIDYSLEDFHGFGTYLKLDNKVSQAYVKLERLDPQIIKLYEVKSKSQDKPTFCLFCNQFKTQLRRHLRLIYKDQNIVKQIIGNNNCDSSLKNSAVSFVRSQGYGHFQELTGITIPNKNARVDAKTSVNKVQCDNCYGYISEKTMWKHRQTCLTFTVSDLRTKFK